MSRDRLRQQFVDTLKEIASIDQNLIVLVGDISHFKLQPFAKLFPDRYYNVGICEPTIVSMAGGLSKLGFHPVVHTIAPFIIERAFEQIKLDFCYHKLGGNLVTVGSAFDYSNLGCTHHCYDDFALLKTLPGAEIIYPGSPKEFDLLFKQTYDNNRLTLFRLPAFEHGVDFDNGKIGFGKCIKVTEGKNLTIIVTGPHLATALAAKNSLRGIGWDAEILYIHTISPLDTRCITSSIKKTKHVLVIEEHMRNGGLGDDVLRACKDIFGAKYSFLSIPNTFITEYGTYEDHCHRLGFTPEGILNRVKSDFKK